MAAGLLSIAMVGALAVTVSRPPSQARHAGRSVTTQPPAADFDPRVQTPSGPSDTSAGITNGAGSNGMARLVISSIGVDAAVESVGLDSSGAMGVPSSAADVGWYSSGPWPGSAGDAVIDGHLDWYGVPAVFWHLDRLKPGDTLVLIRDGETSTFRVTRVTTYGLSEEPSYLFGATGPAMLSLITCAGVWDSNRQIYQERLVVDAAPGSS